MGKETEIGWTDASWNPWIGCTKVSPACDNCYAERDNEHRKWVQIGGEAAWGKDAPRRLTSDAYWKQPLTWNRQADGPFRVFCGSLCDVMEDRDDLNDHRERLYELIEQTPNLDWLLLTKRPQNFLRFFPKSWLESPRKNVIPMTTVESAQYLWRVDALTRVPAVCRGLSVEPMLGPLKLWPYLPENSFDPIGWVIVGGGSGPSARPMHPHWARILRDQCVERGIPFFFKQWGEWAPVAAPRRDTQHCIVREKFIQYHADWADVLDASGGDQAFARVGRKAAGRLLDGVEWNQVPELPR